MTAGDGDTGTGPGNDREDTAALDTAQDTAAGSAVAGAGLSAAAREWVRRTVAELGPLTEDERAYLAYMFHRRV